jgi:peptide/nickel transport system permease protein
MIDYSKLIKHFFRSPTAVFSGLLIVFFLFLAISAPLTAPHNPYDLTAFTLADGMKPPSWEAGGDAQFILGTDEQGRCILSTIMFGLRTSFMVGFGTILVSVTFGTVMGLLAGYFQRWTDAVISRMSDIMLSFPAFLIAVLLLGVIKQQGVFMMILALSICHWVRYCRVMRGNVFVVREREFVDAARSLGAGHGRILFSHIMPNAISTLFVIGAVDLGIVIVQESTLSFLGIGVPLTTPSLGMMISSGYTFLFAGIWWVTFFPGIVLALLILSINLLGDWFRREINPKL